MIDGDNEYNTGYKEGMRFNALTELYVERRMMNSKTSRGFYDAIQDGNTQEIDAPVQLFLDLFFVIGLAEGVNGDD